MSAPVPFYDRILDDIREQDAGYGTLANPFPSTGFYIYDSSNERWLVTIDTTGHLVTTFYEPPVGSSIGLLLALTYT